MSEQSSEPPCSCDNPLHGHAPNRMQEIRGRLSGFWPGHTTHKDFVYLLELVERGEPTAVVRK